MSPDKKPPKRRARGEDMTLMPRQVQILRLVHQWRVKNGCSPTMREMGQELRLNRVTVFGHVETLVEMGLVRRQPNKARSLTLDPKLDLVGLGIVSPSPPTETTPTPAERGQYPLAGTIAAGLPIEAVEQPETLALDSLFETRAGTFALQVRGDSMIDEHICDGDYVLVSREHSPRNGQVVVALLENGEATLKRFYKEGKSVRLQPANAAYEPLWLDKVDVQGVVVGVVRRC